MRKMLLLGLMLAAMCLQRGAADLALGTIQRVAGSDIGEGGDVGQYTSFAQDGFGGQHIAYYDATNKRLKYARRPRLGAPWIIETVDAGPDAGRYASIAVRNPQPIFMTQAFFKNGSTSATVFTGQDVTKRLIGGRIQLAPAGPFYVIVDSPTSQTITLATPYAGPSTIGVPDNSNIEYYHPAIAYQKTFPNGGTAAMLAMPQLDGTFFLSQVDPVSSSTVVSTDRKGFYTSVDVTTDTHIHMVWQNRDFAISPVGTLHHAITQTTFSVFVNYTYDQPDLLRGRGTHARMALGGPHLSPAILYQDEDGLQLWAAWFEQEQNVWHNYQIQGSGLNPGTAIDLRYAPGRNQWGLLWQQGTVNPFFEAAMAQNTDASTATFSFVRSADELTSGPTLGNYVAVGAGNGPLDMYYLMYYAANRQILFRQATATDGVYTPLQVLDGRVDPGRYISAGVNPVDNHLYASYYDSGSGALKLGAYDGVTTSSQYIDGYKVGTYSSVVNTSTTVYVAYRSDVDSSVHVASWPLGTGPTSPFFTDIQIDNSSANLGEFVSMVCDGNDRLYVAYFDRFFKRLRMATYDGTTWFQHDIETEVVGNPGSQGEFVRLVIDQTKTQISAVYYDSDNHRLKVGQAPVAAPGVGDPYTTMTITLLPLASGTGRFVSAAYAGGSDLLYLSYFNDNTLGLDFATFDGVDTVQESVESGIFNAVGQYTSVAFNPDTNFPMIAYYDISNGALKFAEKTSAGWLKATLDNVSDTGFYPLMQVDQGHNLVTIVYYSPTAKCFKGVERPLDGDTWVGPITLATDGKGVRPSGNIQPDGTLVLAFYDETKGDLLTTTASTAIIRPNAARRGWQRYH